MQRIDLNQIVVDAGTQVRASISEDVVADYCQHILDGDEFPPVVVFHDGNAYYLGDGFHRVLATRRAGRESIHAEVRQGTRQDALWFALGANRRNGARLTPADKRHAIELALHTWPERSVNQIADQIGVNQRYAASVKSEVSATTNLPSRVTGKDGKSYPATRPQPKPTTSETTMDVQPLYGQRKAQAERFEALKAGAAEGASTALLRRLPKKSSAELMTNVVQNLQGVVSALDQIAIGDVISHPDAPFWRAQIAEAIGALRAVNRQLTEAA